LRNQTVENHAFKGEAGKKSTHVDVCAVTLAKRAKTGASGSRDVVGSQSIHRKKKNVKAIKKKVEPPDAGMGTQEGWSSQSSVAL